MNSLTGEQALGATEKATQKVRALEQINLVLTARVDSPTSWYSK